MQHEEHGCGLAACKDQFKSDAKVHSIPLSLEP
jgi:hypothetical protein